MEILLLSRTCLHQILTFARHKDVVIWTASGIRGKAARKKLVYKLMRKGDKPSEGIARCAFIAKFV
ncbi:hypothetical protein C5167_024001 [Papaver somniferum]|uniref:Uncharacterized protein n=1 Tax=Papaver somniferum TaxID=3469 RepID=A0A4Y7JQC0_PAPSO|nr:hypothetical protein C5167_024001 [Papaver somniferum]